MSWNPVVAGVDTSPEGALAATAAWSVAKATGAAFHLVHVAREVSQLPPVAPGTMAEEELAGKLQQAARGQVEEALRDRVPAEALEHLDFAISEFRDMKMQPSLERALRHKEILGA
jgi:nucleotide-binding universal stress UspA family protein